MRVRLSSVLVALALVLGAADAALAQRALVWVPTANGDRPFDCASPEAAAAGQSCARFFATLTEGTPVLGEPGFTWRLINGSWSAVGANPGAPGCIDTYPGVCLAPPPGTPAPVPPPVRFAAGRYYLTPYSTLVYIAGSVVRVTGQALWVGECLWGADCSGSDRLMHWPLDYNAQVMQPLTRAEAEAFLASRE